MSINTNMHYFCFYDKEKNKINLDKIKEICDNYERKMGQDPDSSGLHMYGCIEYCAIAFKTISELKEKMSHDNDIISLVELLEKELNLASFNYWRN